MKRIILLIIVLLAVYPVHVSAADTPKLPIGSDVFFSHAEISAEPIIENKNSKIHFKECCAPPELFPAPTVVPNACKTAVPPCIVMRMPYSMIHIYPSENPSEGGLYS